MIVPPIYAGLSSEQITLLNKVINRGEIKKILFGFELTYQNTIVKLYKRNAKVKIENKVYFWESPDFKIFYDKCKDAYKAGG